MCYSGPCIVVLTASEPEPILLSKELPSVSSAKEFLESFLVKLGSQPKGQYSFTVELHSGGKMMKPAIYVAHVFGDYYMYSLRPSNLGSDIMPEKIMQKQVDWH